MRKNWNGYETGNLLITNRKWDSHMCEFIMEIGSFTLLLFGMVQWICMMCDGGWCGANCRTFIRNVCAFVTSVGSSTLNKHTHVSYFRFHIRSMCMRSFVRACLQVSECASPRSCAYWWCSFNQTVNSTDGVDLKLHSKTYTRSFASVLRRGGRLFVFSFSFYSIFSTRFFTLVAWCMTIISFAILILLFPCHSSRSFPMPVLLFVVGFLFPFVKVSVSPQHHDMIHGSNNGVQKGSNSARCVLWKIKNEIHRHIDGKGDSDRERLTPMLELVKVETQSTNTVLHGPIHHNKTLFIIMYL